MKGLIAALMGLTLCLPGIIIYAISEMNKGQPLSLKGKLSWSGFWFLSYSSLVGVWIQSIVLYPKWWSIDLGVLLGMVLFFAIVLYPVFLGVALSGNEPDDAEREDEDEDELA